MMLLEGCVHRSGWHLKCQNLVILRNIYSELSAVSRWLFKAFSSPLTVPFKISQTKILAFFGRRIHAITFIIPKRYILKISRFFFQKSVIFCDDVLSSGWLPFSMHVYCLSRAQIIDDNQIYMYANIPNVVTLNKRYLHCI